VGGDQFCWLGPVLVFSQCQLAKVKERGNESKTLTGKGEGRAMKSRQNVEKKREDVQSLLSEKKNAEILIIDELY